MLDFYAFPPLLQKWVALVRSAHHRHVQLLTRSGPTVSTKTHFFIEFSELTHDRSLREFGHHAVPSSFANTRARLGRQVNKFNNSACERIRISRRDDKTRFADHKLTIPDISNNARYGTSHCFADRVRKTLRDRGVDRDIECRLDHR